MRVTYQWLKDFVDISVSPKALADALSMAGLEVTGLEAKDGDYVFEIEITSNRPDWLSVLGVAREVAAITGKKLKSQGHKGTRAQVKFQDRQKFSIKIEDSKDCPLYTAKIIRGVKVGPSSEWLKKRLELVGCRSINNVVDSTNYCLFELGEPLHAFDLERLRGEAIIVRRSRQEEKITIIDGSQCVLTPEVLVIADKEKPVAIAGIMGGLDTEVSEKTSAVLLEAAVFNPIVTRRAKRALALSTESAYRFERSIDLGIVEQAAWRAAGLIRKLAGGRVVYAGSSPVPKVKKVSLAVDADFVSRVSGITLGYPTIKRILHDLGFALKATSGGSLAVSVPSYRPDVVAPIDLVEEITRIYGFSNIPTTLPPIKPQGIMHTTRDSVSAIKGILVGLGLQEAITYSLIDKDTLEGLEYFQGTPLAIANPLSQEQGLLRPTLLPGLLSCVSHNLRQQQEVVAVFEIAKGFYQAADEVNEEWRLGIALCGYGAQGLSKDEAGFLHIKGILETLFKRLGIGGRSAFSGGPCGNEVLVRIGNERAGVLVKAKADVLDRFDIKNKEVFLAEVELEKLFSRIALKKRFVPLPNYPSIARDISLIVKEDARADEILNAIRGGAGGLLREVRIADYYKGKQIPAGFKSITLSCVYRSDERTLTEEEVNPVHARVRSILEDTFQAKIR